jgi:hypothetical protein
MPVRDRRRAQSEPAVVLVPAFEPAGVTSPVCGLTRFLLVGFVIGTVVSSVTESAGGAAWADTSPIAFGHRRTVDVAP